MSIADNDAMVLIDDNNSAFTETFICRILG